MHIYEADLSSQESVGRFVSRVLADGHRIDILLNWEGVQHRMGSHRFQIDAFNHVRSRFGPFSNPCISVITDMQVIQVNLTTVFTLCQDAGAHKLFG